MYPLTSLVHIQLSQTCQAAQHLREAAQGVVSQVEHCQPSKARHTCWQRLEAVEAHIQEPVATMHWVAQDVRSNCLNKQALRTCRAAD
jgi:hypothetical protein